MLVCNFCADFPPTCQRKFVRRLRTWRLRDPEAQLEYHVAFITRRPEPMLAAVWRKICGKWQSSLLKATEIVCTITKKKHIRDERRPGGEMQQSTMQSRNSGDVGKPKKPWQQGGISEGQASRQTSCLSGKIPGRSRSPQRPFIQQNRLILPY